MATVAHLIVFFLFCILLRQDDNSSQSKKKGRSKEGNAICFSISLSQKCRQISRQNAKKNQKTRCYLSTHRKLKKEDSHIYISFLFLVLFYFIIVYLFLLLNLFFFLKISASLAPFPIWQAWSRKTKQNKNQNQTKNFKTIICIDIHIQ